MKRFLKILIMAVVSSLLAVSCYNGGDVVFDHPFIYITSTNNSMTSTVDSQGRSEITYWVYMSTKAIANEVNVDFETVVGNGLTEGLDFEYVTSPSQPLSFPSGIYERRITIKWLPKIVDEAKDNTLKIILTGNSANFTLGFPGPDKLFSTHTITKVNTD